MTKVLRRKVTVQAGGLIEIRSLELIAGSLVEAIVLVESEAADDARTSHVAELNALLKRTQELPGARVITEQEIAAEVALYRASRR